MTDSTGYKSPAQRLAEHMAQQYPHLEKRRTLPPRVGLLGIPQKKDTVTKAPEQPPPKEDEKEKLEMLPMAETPPDGVITLQKVKEVGADLSHLTVAELESPSYKKRLARFRQALVYFSREGIRRADQEKYTLVQIAEVYGKRHYTTIKHSIEQIEELRRFRRARTDEDTDLLEFLENLCKHFRVSLPRI